MPSQRGVSPHDEEGLCCKWRQWAGEIDAFYFDIRLKNKMDVEGANG